MRDAVSILMTLKVTNQVRASIVDMVLARLGSDLQGADIPLLVDDASLELFGERVRERAATVSSNVTYRRDDRPMAVSYLDLLERCITPYCYLQFDDQITTNLSPSFLLAACRLLERHGDLVPLVSAVWPMEVSVDEPRREVQVVAHRQIAGRESYQFGGQRPHRPVLIDEVDGYHFGIFENFYYGLYFNHIVTRADDLASRLQWFLDEVGSTSVHDIENASSDRTIGPFWTHIAVCLDGVALLDVDHSHTEASVRPEASTARRVYDALSAGFDIRTSAAGAE